MCLLINVNELKGLFLLLYFLVLNLSCREDIELVEVGVFMNFFVFCF